MNMAYNMDCMEYMRTLPDKAFDLACVDPMYGIGENGAKSGSRAKLAKRIDYKPVCDDPPTEEYFAELFRVSKHQVIWGANHFIAAFGKNASCWLVWDKNNGDTNYADCELAWTSFPGAVRKFKYLWAGMRQERQGKNHQFRIHPCEKPIALYAWIFSRYAKPGDKILDTHLGSGSSRIAAYDAGLDFVGCEIDSDYFKAQEDRFAIYTAQENLFLQMERAE
ncbi:MULTISPECIES: DNA methyltransferase [Agathobaculum]|uniref:DNA methyltransferase n=1 Tax=Agathobaculum TaxID=2048137 RepID=UPI00262AC5A0|nr:DNA methyltransferase [uncultured Agathobaculum sp.]